MVFAEVIFFLLEWQSCSKQAVKYAISHDECHTEDSIKVSFHDEILIEFSYNHE